MPNSKQKLHAHYRRIHFNTNLSCIIYFKKYVGNYIELRFKYLICYISYENKSSISTKNYFFFEYLDVNNFFYFK